MATLSNVFEQKTSKTSINEFVCFVCDYNTDRKCNYDRHILSSKHQRQQKISKMSKKDKLTGYCCEKLTGYCCENCGK